MEIIVKNISQISLALLFLVINPVKADSDYNRAQQLNQSGDILPLELILKSISKNHPGKVLEVELENEHSMLIYEIEILDENGIVTEINVNATTGEIVQNKRDD